MSNSSLLIREARLDDPRDAESVVKLVDSYASDIIGGGKSLTPEARERLIPALIAHPSKLIFLAYQGEESVGLALCFIGFSSFQAKPLINIHDLAVLPNHRGQGIGHRLIDAVAVRGRELGCCKMTLEVRPDNEPGLALYKKAGFNRSMLGNYPYWMMDKSL